MMNERFAMLFPLGLGGDPACPPERDDRTAPSNWLGSLLGLLCAHRTPPCPR